MCEALVFADALVCPCIGCDGEMLAASVRATHDRPGLAFLKCSDCGIETDHLRVAPPITTAVAES